MNYNIPKIINPISELSASPILKKIGQFTRNTIGDPTSYISDIFGIEQLESIPLGQSAIISAPVGSGKTTSIINSAIKLPTKTDVYIVTNRKASQIQIKRDLLKCLGFNTDSWPVEAILNSDTNNIQVITYQALSDMKMFYFKNNTVLFLDEIHYLLNDSTFSLSPMRIKELLKLNLSKTKKVYISATIDEVLKTILEIECDNGYNLSYNYSNTFVNHIYCMDTNWSHLKFRFYTYTDIDELVNVIQNDNDNGIKSAIFVRNKDRGFKLKEGLTESSFIYSSDECEDLNNLAITEKTNNNCIVATKVIENGISINDTDIGTIVIDEIDPVSFMQFLGRVRVKRKKPRNLTIYIPDYTVSELILAKKQLIEKMKIIKAVRKDPDFCLSRYELYEPYVYYSYFNQKAQVNTLAERKLDILIKHIDSLINDTKPHSHIRYILNMLNLDEDVDNKAFLSYDGLEVFKTKVKDAFDRFIKSDKLKTDRDEFAKSLIYIVSSTNVYKNKCTGKQLQLEKINDILSFAGIEKQLVSLGEAFSTTDKSD